MDREVEGGDDSTVVDVCESSTNNVQRKRKKRSFGKDFEENNDSEESDDSRENESMCHSNYHDINGNHLMKWDHQSVLIIKQFTNYHPCSVDDRHIHQNYNVINW